MEGEPMTRALWLVLVAASSSALAAACAGATANGGDAGGDGARDGATAGSDGTAGDTSSPGDDDAQGFPEVVVPDVRIDPVDGGTEFFNDADMTEAGPIAACCNGAVCHGQCVSVNAAPPECWCHGIVGGCVSGQSCCIFPHGCAGQCSTR